MQYFWECEDGGCGDVCKKHLCGSYVLKAYDDEKLNSQLAKSLATQVEGFMNEPED